MPSNNTIESIKLVKAKDDTTLIITRLIMLLNSQIKILDFLIIMHHILTTLIFIMLWFSILLGGFLFKLFFSFLCWLCFIAGVLLGIIVVHIKTLILFLFSYMNLLFGVYHSYICSLREILPHKVFMIVTHYFGHPSDQLTTCA